MVSASCLLLPYAFIALPVVFLTLYSVELVAYINSIDPSVHPEYNAHCGERTSEGRKTEVVEFNGSLYCCRVPLVECSSSINNAYIEQNGDVTMCFIDERYTTFTSGVETETFNTTEVFKATIVEAGGAASGLRDDLWLYCAVASIGFIALVSFATNKMNFALKSVTFAAFLAELAIGTIILLSESDSVILWSPYEGSGGTGGSHNEIVKWKGLFLLLSVESEWLCDAMIFCSSIKQHLDGKHGWNTLEADGWNEKASPLPFFVFVQFSFGVAYMVSASFGCDDFATGGWIPVIGLAVSCCMCCLCLSSPLWEGDVIHPKVWKRIRLSVSLLITEIPGILLNPSIDGLGGLFLTLAGYTILEASIDVIGNYCGTNLNEIGDTHSSYYQ